MSLQQPRRRTPKPNVQLALTRIKIERCCRDRRFLEVIRFPTRRIVEGDDNIPATGKDFQFPHPQIPVTGAGSPVNQANGVSRTIGT